MSSRIDYYKASPEAVKAILGLEGYVNHCGLEKLLLELVKLRASQMNGCAYCVDVHTSDMIIKYSLPMLVIIKYTIN